MTARIFSRGREQMRLENRYDTETAEFLLVIEHHDGSRETKRFTEALDFRAWLSAFERRLATEQWTASGMDAGTTDRRLDRPGESPVGAISATTTRRYTSGARTFEILVCERALPARPFAWTVERVVDVSWAYKVTVIPGMEAVMGSSAELAFARACDCIDKWLWDRFER